MSHEGKWLPSRVPYKPFRDTKWEWGSPNYKLRRWRHVIVHLLEDTQAVLLGKILPKYYLAQSWIHPESHNRVQTIKSYNTSVTMEYNKNWREIKSNAWKFLLKNVFVEIASVAKDSQSPRTCFLFKQKMQPLDFILFHGKQTGPKEINLLIPQWFFTIVATARMEMKKAKIHSIQPAGSFLKMSAYQAVDPTCLWIGEKETHDPIENLRVANLMEVLNGLGADWPSNRSPQKGWTTYVQALTVLFNWAFLKNCNKPPYVYCYNKTVPVMLV